MRDMADSCATLSVASCYTLRSNARSPHAEGRPNHAETPRPRLPHRAADHGTARSPGPALDVAHHVGAARWRADLARAPHRLRRGLADGAQSAAEGAARSGLRRAWRWRLHSD